MIRAFVYFAVLLVAAGTTLSQEIQIDRIAMSSGTEETVKNHIAAIEAEDIAAYEETMLDDSTVVYYLFDGRTVVGWPSLRETMSEWFATVDSIAITMNDFAVEVSPHQTRATATCAWDYSALENGERVQQSVRCTFALTKWVYGWKIRHFHLSPATD